jgi:hypothetical protein
MVNRENDDLSSLGTFASTRSATVTEPPARQPTTLVIETRGRATQQVGSPTRLQIACIVVAALLFAIEKVRVVIGIGLRFTTEDQTIFWYVARDFMRLKFPEPLFYGSPYSSHLESLLAVPLMAAGMPGYVAIPVITGALMAAPWALLAFVAWQRGRYASAIAVLCAQFLLPVEFGAIATQAAQGTGVAVGGIGAALLLGTARPAIRCATFGVLGTLGFCLHPNSVFLIAPAAAYLFLTHYRSRKFWLWCVPGAAIVAGLDLLALQFYARNPTYVLHGQWPMELQWEMFVEGINNLDRHLGDLTPTQFHAAGFLTLGVVMMVWLSMITRQWRLTFVSSLLVIGVLASLSITKLHNGSASFIFPHSRALYSFPLATWWLAVLWAGVTRSPSGPAARYAGAIAAAALLVLGVWRQVTLTSEMDRLLAIPSTVVSSMPTKQVLQDCRRLRAIATAHEVDLVMHAQSRLKAYACGAEWYGQLDTLYPPYDRRTTNMLAERDRVRSRILVAEPAKKVCGQARKHGLACEMIEGEPRVALISSPAVSALSVAEWVGIEVRHL